MEDIQIVMEWYNKLTKILLGLGMLGGGVSIYLFFHFRIYQMLNDHAGRSIRRSIRESSRKSERKSGRRSGSGKMVSARQRKEENLARNRETGTRTEEDNTGATMELCGKNPGTDAEFRNKTEDKSWVRKKIVLIHTSQRITESGRLVNE